MMKQWLVKFENTNTQPYEDWLSTADKTEVSTNDRSTQGGSRQWNFNKENEKDELGKLFFERMKYIEEIKQYPLKEITGAWYVEGNQNAYHRLHNHTQTKVGAPMFDGLSCLLYLEVPDAKDTGEFYFLIKHDDGTIRKSTIMPKKGDMIVMPKTIFHGVYPQSSIGMRRTLNIDFNIYEKNN